MKKYINASTLAILLSIPVFSSELNIHTIQIFPIENSNTSATKELFSEILEDNFDESQKLLTMSEKIKNTSLNLDSSIQLNKKYIDTMLKLTEEIGKMADRIGEMADKIVQTEVLIGNMADRIVIVAQNIINNNTQTQLNLLQSQQNFNNLLVVLSNK